MRPRERPPPADAVRSSLCACLLLLLLRVEAAGSVGAVYNGITRHGSPRSILDKVQSYEIISPTWLHPHRRRRAANKEHPAEAQVQITAEGQELTLHLEKNDYKISIQQSNFGMWWRGKFASRMYSDKSAAAA